jgi:hypothetical protein
MLQKTQLTEPKQVAWLLASYAREARARAEDHDLPAFRNVKRALEESLGIEFEGDKGGRLNRRFNSQRSCWQTLTGRSDAFGNREAVSPQAATRIFP